MFSFSFVRKLSFHAEAAVLGVQRFI